jgi:hypothetical protein
MVRSRLGLKVLVIGVMAISASAAQAEASGEWLLGGNMLSNYTAGLEPEIASELENAMSALLTEILGKTVRFLCTTATLSGVKMQTGGLLKPGGKARLTGCKTFLGKLNAKEEVIEESESAVCEPFTINAKKEKEKGVVETGPLKGLLALNAAKETETLVEPEVVGGTFVTMHFSETCAVGEEVPVSGKLYLKDCNKEGLVDKTSHLLEEDTTLSQLWVISDTAEHLRTKLDGSAIVKLAAAPHTNMTFAGHEGMILPGHEAEWLLGGKALSNYTVGLEPEVQSSLESAMGALLTEILGKTVRFLCTTATLSGVKMQTGGLLKPGGSARLEGCKTFLGKLNAKEEAIEEAESKPCEPFTVNAKKEKEAGVVVTNKLKGLLALNAAKETETLVEPETAGGPFATIHMSELCSIGEEVPLFGKLYLKDSKGEALVDKAEHLLEEDTTLSQLWVISDTAEHLRTKLDGSAIVKLAGAHTGMTFAGHAAA